MKNIFAEICKVDDEKRMVYGYASTEAMDVQGEIVTKAAMAEALSDYMKFANIREMHQPSAVGVAKSAEMDEKGCFISAHVVDDSAWAKVKAGVYKGFSIGGKAITKVEGVINALRLSEISLVDRPANPEALITVWKADMPKTQKTPEAAVDQLAALLNKGDITPQRLIELAEAELAKSATPAPAGDAPAADVAATDDTQKSHEGEEVWDTGTALNALDSIMYLLMKERGELAEGEEPRAPEQVAALKAAIAAIKAFIVSEIMEDNAEEGEAEGAEAGEAVEMSDAGGDIAKVGKAISNKNMKKLQDLHDSLATLGAKCSDMGKHDHEADINKMTADKDEAIAKVAALTSDLAKLSTENTTLKADLEKLKAMPMPGKALLKAITVSKENDGSLESSEEIVKIAAVTDANGETNDVASLIKMIHSKGGVINR